MHPGPENWFAGYANVDESELHRLARSRDELTGIAHHALQDEFRLRGLRFPPREDIAPKTDRGELVTIARYRDLSEAIVARSFLESSGVPAFLCDENLVRLDWQISNFIGGIRLQVATLDEADAIELLSQPVPDSISYGAGGEYPQPHCPVCHSAEVTFQGSARGPALISLYLLSLPLPLGPETWLCQTCGTRWKDARD